MPVAYENGRILCCLENWAPVYTLPLEFEIAWKVLFLHSAFMMIVEYHANSIENNSWCRSSIKIDKTMKTSGKWRALGLVFTKVIRIVIIIRSLTNSDLTAYGQYEERWGLWRGMCGGSSSCRRCCSPVWGSYCSASCAYAGLTSNVEQFPLCI